MNKIMNFAALNCMNKSFRMSCLVFKQVFGAVIRIVGKFIAIIFCFNN